MLLVPGGGEGQRGLDVHELEALLDLCVELLHLHKLLPLQVVTFTELPSNINHEL